MPKPQPDKQGWERENKRIVRKILESNFGRTQWDNNALELIILQFKLTLATEVAREKEKIVDELAHPTKDGYCCACDYDIAVMEDKIKTEIARERERIEEVISFMLWLASPLSVFQNMIERVKINYFKITINDLLKRYDKIYKIIKTLASSKEGEK